MCLDHPESRHWERAFSARHVQWQAATVNMLSRLRETHMGRKEHGED
jgi:hypothetical protein